MTMGFGARLCRAVEETGNAACLGLDPHLDQLPASLRTWGSGPGWRARAADAVLDFNRMAIDAARGHIPAVKPQAAFYEALGSAGWYCLEQTCHMARQAGLLVVMDAKRGDIASTAAAYAEALLDDHGPIGADALTVAPYMGVDVLDAYIPLAREQGKGLFVLMRTTNPGSALLQTHGDPPLAHVLARAVHQLGQELLHDGWSPLGAVVGAQAAAEAPALRALLPDAWFLVPGVGAQGGGRGEAFAGARHDGLGCLVASARGALYPTPSTDRGAFDADPAGWLADSVSRLASSLALRR